MTTNRLGLAAALASLALTWIAAPALAAAPSRPNLLLILADNWSYPHASAYGDKVVRTPTFDALAARGALFNHAFAPFPSCSASRAAMLTGQVIHRLAEGANLHGTLPAKFPVYTDALERAGYFVGYSGKGWGPGSIEASGRPRNPAGISFESPAAYFAALPKDRPFYYWYSSKQPHVGWNDGRDKKVRMNPADVAVPSHLPDHPVVRDDLLNYFCEVETLDDEAAGILKLVADRGLLENTLIVYSSDNGSQLPRGLASCYDSGTRIPMAIRWDGHVEPGTIIDALVSLTDLAPTFLAAAGAEPLPDMTAKSLLPLLAGEAQPDRDHVFVERERHANVRRGDLSYPIRGIRTREHLYLRNLRPDRWPAGDPEFYFAVGPYGDVDGSQSKTLLLDRASDDEFAQYFRATFGKRPAEELYDVNRDPGQMHNLAADPKHQAELLSLRERVEHWMRETGDPRAAAADNDFWDQSPYYGPRAKLPAAK